MPILKNIEAHWSKLSPNKPAPAFGDSGPKWEFIAIARTKAQADEWKALGIKVTPIEEGDKLIYKARFTRPVKNKKGEPNAPVEVVSGQLIPMDPAIIGNGSIVNIVIFQYDYEVKSENGKASKKGRGTMLKKVQVTKLVRYEPQAEEDFEEESFEEVEMTEEQKAGKNKPAAAPSGAGDATPDADF